MLLRPLIFLFFFCVSRSICEAQHRPMSCHIKGKIISVIRNYDKDISSVCSKHPCIARVRIIDVSDCGSSVSIPLNPGTIINLQFAYTLDNTSKIFPGMKVQYAGLKKGDIFSAVSEERLGPGAAGRWLIYGYEKLKGAEPGKNKLKKTARK